MSIQTGANMVMDVTGRVAHTPVGVANPEGVDLIVNQAILDVTTVSAGACTVDIGIASGETTTADNLIDGQDVNAAAGAFGSPSGTNGKPAKKWPAGSFLTIDPSGDSTGLVAKLYVKYTRCEE